MLVLDIRKIADGGIGTYIRNTISAAKSYSLELALVVPSKKALKKRCSGDVYTECREWLGKLKSEHECLETDICPYSTSELTILGAKIKKRFPVSIFHSPHFTLPLGLEDKSIITVHDTILLSHPRSKIKGMVAQSLISSSIKRASKVLTVSKFSKKEITRHFPEATDICVIPHALSPEFYETDIQERFRVLVIGTDRSHKRLRDSFLAWEQFAKQRPDLVSELCLTLVCPELTRENKALFETLPGKKERLSNISTLHLRSLYLQSRALMVSSAVEGYFFPALEATACEVPYVAYDIPALRERQGCSILVPTGDVSLLASGLENLIEGECFSKHSLHQQAEQARRLCSPERFTLELHSVYESLRKPLKKAS